MDNIHTNQTDTENKVSILYLLFDFIDYEHQSYLKFIASEQHFPAYVAKMRVHAYEDIVEQLTETLCTSDIDESLFKQIMDLYSVKRAIPFELKKQHRMQQIWNTRIHDVLLQLDNLNKDD